MKVLKRKRTEKEITAEIRGALRALRVFHWKAFQGGFTPVRGIADILGIYKGRMLAIEVKVRGRKIPDDQQRFIDRINMEGGIGVIAYDWWDVIVAIGEERRFKKVDKAV